MKPSGTLIFFCGKMGAGKSTKAKQLARHRNAVLLSEDEWLSSLYPGQITSFDDYRRYSSQLKPLVKTLVIDMLSTGVDVVMDFPANTQCQRRWFMDLLSEAEAPHQLIYLKASDELCLKQIAKRRVEQPERAAFDTEAVFLHVTQYFNEPNEHEGFNIQLLDGSN